MMKIIELIAENYKRLRVVEITPKGRVVQITGKNGQGKTSVLDAIWGALIGSKGIAEKPVRNGALKARIRMNLGEMIVTRIISPNGTHTLTVETAKGVKVASPQKMLDEMLGELSFDPLAFIGMKPKEQVETLRQIAKLAIDIDALNKENTADYEERTAVNKEVKQLEGEAAAITVQDGLPKEKADEAALLVQIGEVSQKNKQIETIRTAKSSLDYERTTAQKALERKNGDIAQIGVEIAQIEQQLQAKRDQLSSLTEERVLLEKELETIESAFISALNPEYIDGAKLTADLQQAQLINREIDKRTRRQSVEFQLAGKKRESERLTRAIERREEEKIAALATAKLPVEGLTFDENRAAYNGIPLGQLGEAEQIRISTAIAMAANPKLRVIRIMHGESLDEDSLDVIARMAEENDFQIWMAKVDTSGKVGIFLEDGQIKSKAEE